MGPYYELVMSWNVGRRSVAFVYELRDNYLPMGAWCAWVAKRPQVVDVRRFNQ